MGFIKNMISGQFIDVIEWIDDSKDTIVHRYDRNGKDIMMGAQLTVRESQIAVFVNEGQLADVFTPGRYELSTQNMPIMTKIKAWKFGFNSPFKAEVYFISTKQFRDIKWGTTNPVMMRDAEFGMIRIRAFGSLAFRVSDPVIFMKEVFGTNSYFTVEDIAGQLKRVVVSNISDAIAESKIPALDLASNYDELSEFTLNKLRLKVSDLGIYLSSFVIENISLPEEVEKAMDRRTSMGVVGDLDKYSKFQTAEAIRESANNPSGISGMGVGLGAAAAMGSMFTNSLQNNQQIPVQNQKKCIACNATIDANAKFCSVCGASQSTKCPNCGADIEANQKFCSSCGQKL